MIGIVEKCQQLLFLYLLESKELSDMQFRGMLLVKLPQAVLMSQTVSLYHIFFNLLTVN
jgi:hypothetical protein